VVGRTDPGDIEDAKAAAAHAAATFQASDSVEDLDAAIEAYARLIPLLDVEESTHGMAVMELCSLRGVYWVRTRSSEIWEEALRYVRSWRERIPPPDWRAALYILAHGLLLYRRADATEAREDIASAIEVLEAARSRVKPGAGVHGTSSALLASLRGRRFLATRDPLDLEAGIQDALAVLESARALEWEQLVAAKWFAQLSLSRGQLTHSEAGVELAINAARLALERASDPTERGDLEGVLGSALRERFEEHGDPDDLDEAVSAYERSLETPNLPPEVEGARLDNLGNGLASRYKLRHSPDDLDRAIDCSRRALALYPAEDAERGRVHANLGRSLIDRGRDRLDLGTVAEAIDVLREGQRLPDLSPELTARLSVTLAEALSLADRFAGRNDYLDEVIDAAEAALTAVLAETADDPVGYRLSARGRAAVPSRRLVAALLRRSQLRPSSARSDLRRALAVGESGKVPLLTQELLRRSMPAPEGVGEGTLLWEAQLLARLAALDAHEIAPAAGVSPQRVLHRMEQRAALRAALERVWDEMEPTGPHARRYVALRRDLPTALLGALEARPPNVVLLALLQTEELDDQGRWLEGACMLVLAPTSSDPKVVFNVAPSPFPDARERFVKEVPDDRGRTAMQETWWQEFASLLKDGHAASKLTTVVSPVAGAFDFPWNLILERSGWGGTDGETIPVIVVPSLALIVAPPAVGEGWHEVPNIADHLGIPDELGVAENIQALLRMPAEPTGEPLIVGDPTSDLDSASSESLAVAETLGVQPHVGGAATVEVLRDGFSAAALVHVAAHARFDAEDPLQSSIQLADGELKARHLIGAWNTADLVVLSACESGSGTSVVGGEVLGLATALLRSGVRSVIASLWPVDDAATAYLMRHFYAALAGEGPTSAPRALASAMTAVRNEPGWEPPYYWAGFVLSRRGWAEGT
jgi:tetratricopeptide (TPR) repeat protein